MIFPDRPDGRLEPTLDFRRDIVRLIRQYRPQRVVCQSPDRTWSPQYMIGRQHPDHLATGRQRSRRSTRRRRMLWISRSCWTRACRSHKVRAVRMAAPVLNHPVDISGDAGSGRSRHCGSISQLGPRFDEAEAIFASGRRGWARSMAS
ncbi:MAG: hypothetical protein U0841_07930 [Chloroflexia bacterium]